MATPSFEPICGMPCLRVAADLRFELARARAREARRGPLSCPTCPATNPLVIVRRRGVHVCYRDGVRRTEDEHFRGGHVGPIWGDLDSNEHRLLSEARRIWTHVWTPGLCEGCVFGLVGILVVRLCSLGALG